MRKQSESKLSRYQRLLPIGAELLPDKEGVDFRVWAPGKKTIYLILEEETNSPIALTKEKNGYFSKLCAQAKLGSRYWFQIEDNEKYYPDPASRFQPKGPHGPSQVVDPFAYQWHDHDWKGIDSKNQIIYEMHIGTFTSDGTYLSAAEKLDLLADLGVTVIQMMPIIEFFGKFGWGYDGVDYFAPMHRYGSPDDLKFFVDKAHQLNIGVILDIVYNHIGTVGNYLKFFCNQYFSEKYQTDWGDAINYDDHADEVRQFFLANVYYWINEFHFDGFRFDATQNIYDQSKFHILAEISQTLKEKITHKSLYLLAENEPQDTKLVRPFEKGGYGLTALLNDDFHHSVKVKLKGRSDAYFTDYKGTPQELISSIKYGYLYQGQWYRWQNKHRGTPTFDLPVQCFVNFLENHDQIANAVDGKRIHQLTSPSLLRAMTALLLLAPQTPSLFQGQEFAASSPFYFFADHQSEIGKATYQGRLAYFKQFSEKIIPEMRGLIPDPTDEATYLVCQLDWSEREKNKEILNLHKDLIALRRMDPVFSQNLAIKIEGAVLNYEAFLLRYFTDEAERLILINLGVDFDFNPAPEPLIAPPLNCHWQVRWSSEDPKYGGNGIFKLNKKGNWRITGHSLTVLVAEQIGNGK